MKKPLAAPHDPLAWQPYFGALPPAMHEALDLARTLHRQTHPTPFSGATHDKQR